MKKRFFKFATLSVAAVLSASSFISCDDEDEFKSEQVEVSLPCDAWISGLGASFSYKWVWTNRDEAAVELTELDSLHLQLNYKFDSDSLFAYAGDKLASDTSLLMPMVYDKGGVEIGPFRSPYNQTFKFVTKETGVRELKFNYIQGANGLDTEGKSYYKETVVRDTVIKF